MCGVLLQVVQLHGTDQTCCYHWVYSCFLQYGCNVLIHFVSASYYLCRAVAYAWHWNRANVAAVQLEHHVPGSQVSYAIVCNDIVLTDVEQIVNVAS